MHVSDDGSGVMRRRIRFPTARLAIAAFGWILVVAETSIAQSPELYLRSGTLQLAPTSLDGFGPASKRAMLDRHPGFVAKLRGQLLPLLDLRERLGREEAAAYAGANRLPFSDDSVTAIVVPGAGTASPVLADALRQQGASVLRIGANHVKARIPASLLETLAANEPQIDHIRLPSLPNPGVVTEGLTLTHADTWQTCGTAGAGTRVAVVDLGFQGLASAVAAGELPADAVQTDFSGTGMEADTTHGVGVAEIVYDLAPGTELHLIKIADESDLTAAADYCINNGINIINHSVGWYGFNFFDGAAYSSMTPSPVTVANDANAAGILWVNAAGNDALRHWRGPWADANANDALDWSGTVEINQIGYQSVGTTVVLQLTWNAWPTTDQDYDLHLVRWSGNQWVTEAASQDSQTGSQPPTESIAVSVSRTAYYGVAVVRYSATDTSTFILRSFYQGLQYTTSAGSIGCPADAASVVAAGAIDEDVYATGPTESYSALGPTNGAFTGQSVLVKPDVCGPDATASWTYTSGFTGTSAASPHIAGLAALVLGSNPTYTNADIRSYLQSHTVDLGTTGQDNTYGYGPVVLPALSAPSITQHPQSRTVCRTACGGGSATFTVSATGTPTPTYQWRKGGLDIPDATLDTLTIDPVLPEDIGTYDVVVTNTCSSQISDPASLAYSVLPDLDCDTDVDGFDFLTFSNCYNGSNRTPQPACETPCADLDTDDDVDGFDFLTFANCYNGSGRTPLCQ